MNIIFSKILLIQLSIDTGLFFATLLVSPVLWTGITLASFNLFGKTPVFKDRFTIGVLFSKNNSNRARSLSGSESFAYLPLVHSNFLAKPLAGKTCVLQLPDAFVQLPEYDRNENMRISSGGNSSGHTHHDVIFCNKGCDWWINKSCLLYLCLFATIRLIKDIYKTYYGVRSMNHFYFDEFINILIIHQFEQARVCSKRFESVRSTSDSHHLLILWIQEIVLILNWQQNRSYLVMLYLVVCW